MLPVEKLAGNFEALGISDDSRVIIYFSRNWVTPAARVYLSLDRLGLGHRTSILDGGLNAWNAEERPLSTEVPEVRRGTITPRPQDVLVDRTWLVEHRESPGIAVVDARTSDFYTGRRGGHGMPRAGHIAGAGNLPFTSVVGKDLKILEDRELEKLLRAARVERGDLVVTYCHIGQQASLVYLAARRMGYDARLYDGSFEEWSQFEELPVDYPAAAERARLISTAELADLLEGGEVSVVDMRSDLRDYLEGHIPGALYAHYETLRATRYGTPAHLLADESYAAILSRLGIRHDRPVVVYGWGGTANFNATFLVWILRGFGHPSVHLLDGGYSAWVDEGRATSQRYPEVGHAEPMASEFKPAVAHLDMVRWVVENAGSEDASSMVLVDVRPTDQYRGEAGPQLRRGHIPGAINHVWSSDLMTKGTVKVWKPLEELRAAYEEQGITRDKHVIAYCNTGTEATHVYFALHELLGYPNVDVYVPSWTDWSAREELPITRTARAGEGR